MGPDYRLRRVLSTRVVALVFSPASWVQTTVSEEYYRPIFVSALIFEFGSRLPSQKSTIDPKFQFHFNCFKGSRLPSQKSTIDPFVVL